MLKPQFFEAIEGQPVDNFQAVRMRFLRRYPLGGAQPPQPYTYPPRIGRQMLAALNPGQPDDETPGLRAARRTRFFGGSTTIGRVSQLLAEAVASNPNLQARVSQVLIEVVVPNAVYYPPGRRVRALEFLDEDLAYSILNRRKTPPGRRYVVVNVLT